MPKTARSSHVRFPDLLFCRRIARCGCVAIAFGLLSGRSDGAAIVDGTKDDSYGEALAVQTVQTQFGDNFTEWNAAYAKIESGTLSVMLTGNLESNFNKLEIFIDSKPGGQSIFASAGNDSAQRMDGLIFDAGFTADYHIIVRRGSARFDLDFADLAAHAFSSHQNVFGGTDAGSGMTGTGVNLTPISVAYDGSNTGGIVAGTDAADQAAALSVTTGLEFAISLADLGYTAGPIRIMVGQNGTGHDFWSNQFLSGLPPPQGNLGSNEMGTFIAGQGAINMQHFAGDQFFVIVPEPGALSLATLSLPLLLPIKRRRRPAEGVGFEPSVG